MRITGSFEPVILIRFYRGVISQPLFRNARGMLKLDMEGVEIEY